MDINNFCTACGKTTSLQLICEKCKEIYILGIEATSITSEETAAMMYMVIGNMPKTLMIGHGDRNSKDIIKEALFTAKSLGPQRGWQCYKCHNTNTWNPILPTASMIKQAEPKVESKKQAEPKVETKKEAELKVAPHKPIIEWVDIAAGTFIMGSPSSEVNRESDEMQHKVTLSAFKMSKYPVTFEQYDLFCEATGRTGRSKPSDEGWGRGNRPVVNVDWDDANAFAEWIGYRLPTEAEWEYACRAGTPTPFNTGNNLTTSKANYGNYLHMNNAKEKTMPVGSFAANSYGLHDMHGNVWELCSDWYGDYSSSAIININPNGALSGTRRVARGGCWRSDSRECRSAYRSHIPPYYHDNNIGFRLVSPK
jgi:formylglycine-generating enzyme required for sulfatase activity